MTVEAIKLTSENYYSAEMNQQYMSYSQYKEFKACPARAMAKLFCGWEDQKNEAFLLGQYVHAWNEGPEALENFKKTTPELFTKKGELYSNYKYADTMIRTLTEDELCMFILAGEKEVIYSAEFAGCIWKIKIDSDNDEWFADLKTIKSINEKFYGGISWVENYGYIGQLALYQEIKKRDIGMLVEPYIVAVTKENPPDKAIIKFDKDRLKYELDIIAFDMPRILDIKTGKSPAARCEKCAYCRETKRCETIIHYSEL